MRKMSSIGKRCVYLLFCNIIFQCCSSPGDNAYKPSPQKESSTPVPPVEASAKVEKAGPHSFTVEIKKMKFSPEEITVHKGDTITWINQDFMDHNITEEKAKAWSSSTLPPGKSWNMVVLNDADYLCTIHPVMKGKIIVK